MDTIEQASSSTNSPENEPNDEPKQYKNNYASEVSRRQYLNNRTADVFFTFDDSSERVPAHKSVLAAASDVFDRIFYGPMAVHGDVPLPGKLPKIFKSFLQFCYLDEVVLKPDNITDVMSLLHEYQMKEGLMVCWRYLAENWTIENICSMYDWAINLQMEEFQAFCEHKMSAHILDIFKTNGFLSSSFNVIEHILALDSLLCDETVVLGACLDWARHQCKQNGKDETDMGSLREYLIDNSTGRNLLWRIRYGSIAQDALLTHLTDWNVFGGLFGDFEECHDIMRLLWGAKDLKTGKILMEPRKLKWNKNAVEYSLLTNPRLVDEVLISKHIVNVLVVDGLMLLEGFYNAPLFADSKYTASTSFPAKLLIKEEPMNGLNESKIVHNDRLTFEDDQELYFQLKPNAIVLKPGYEYHFEFFFESTKIEYRRFDIINKVKVSEYDSIFSRLKYDWLAPFIIKKMKLKLLN